MNPNHINFYFSFSSKTPIKCGVTFIDSSSIQISWLPPDMNWNMNCSDVDGYRIYCFEISACSVNNYDLSVETPSHSSSVTIHDPYDNDKFGSCFFYCCVSGSNNAGEGPQNCMIGRECLYDYCYIHVLLLNVQLSSLQEM